MADLNSLLRWAVENSTATQPGAQPAAENSDAAPEAGPSAPAEGMKLTYKPAVEGQSASATAAALHPTDAQYPVADLSPASTPGPGTPATAAGDLPPARSDLTTEMLDLIMGKSDSLTMKEKMAVATNESADLEERVDALDEFEMLIELIDNANNMAVLKLWTPLLGLFDSPHPEIVRHALWIAGTACQNNLKAQASLFLHDAFPKILDLLYPATGSVSGPTRAKAVYALSSALKHWPLAASVLAADNDRGYKALARGVADDDRVIRRKVAFLLGTLVAQAGDPHTFGELPSEVRALLEERAKSAAPEEDLIKGLERAGVFAAAVSGLQRSAGSADADDVEYEENVVRALARASAADGLSAAEKTAVRGVWEQWGAKGQEERGFEGAEVQEIGKALA